MTSSMVLIGMGFIGWELGFMVKYKDFGLKEDEVTVGEAI
jgi:hypothetical protein